MLPRDDEEGLDAGYRLESSGGSPPDRPRHIKAGFGDDDSSRIRDIRNRPIFYLGSVGPKGLHKLVELMIGSSFGDLHYGEREIALTVHEDDSVSVEIGSIGNLMPVAKSEQGAIQALLSPSLVLVCALSASFELEMPINGSRLKQSWTKGEVTSVLIVADESRIGTLIRFSPDMEIFHDIDEHCGRVPITLAFETLKWKMFEFANLNPGFHIALTDERQTGCDGKALTEAFYSKNGLLDGLAYVNSSRKLANGVVIWSRQTLSMHERSGAEIQVNIEFALQWLQENISWADSFVNKRPTSKGGTHVDGFEAGITAALDQYLQTVEPEIALIYTLRRTDIQSGLTGLLAVQFPDPVFEDLESTRLANVEIKSVVEEAVRRAVFEFLIDNPEEARKITEKIVPSRVRKVARGKS